MGIFSSKNRKVNVNERDNILLQLKQQRDALKQYQKKIIGVIEKDRQVAIQLLQQNKRDRAKLLLRKKRYQEDLLQQTSGQLDNIENMINEVEFASVKITVIENLKQGNLALKKLSALFSVEDVQNILLETEEYKDKIQEIDAILSNCTTAEEESAVEDELEELLLEQLPEAPSAEMPENLVESSEKEGKPAAVPAAKNVRSREAALAN